MNATAGKIVIDGNAATALGCLFAGVTVVSWYRLRRRRRWWSR